MQRRGRVMAAYAAAAAALAQSPDAGDQALARETQRFATRLTDTSTRRMAVALSLTLSGRSITQASDREAPIKGDLDDARRSQRHDKRPGRER